MMNNVIQAVSLLSSELKDGRPSQALAQVKLDSLEEKTAFKYGTLYTLAADEGNREQARYYHRVYRRALRKLN